MKLQDQISLLDIWTYQHKEDKLMIELFGALADVFEQLEAFSDFLGERMTAGYEGLSQDGQTAVMIVMAIVALLIIYFFEVILRMSFNHSTRKLVNVRREYQITLNRAEGKRCNFIWDILLYQKMIILDDQRRQYSDLNETQ